MGLLLTFETIHDALAAEKAYAGSAELVPLPPRVKSDCGFGLLVADSSDPGAEIVARLRGSGSRIAGIYAVIESDAESGKRKEKTYERIY